MCLGCPTNLVGGKFVDKNPVLGSYIQMLIATKQSCNS